MFYNDNWFTGAVFDEEGNVVQFNTLIGGETGFEMELINQEHTTGDYQSGERDAMILASPEYDGEAQISSWKTSKTPLRAVALCRGINGRNMRWLEYTVPEENIDNLKPVRSEGDNFLRIMLNEFDVNVNRQRNLIYNETGTDMVMPLAGPTLTLAAEDLANPFTLTLTAYDYGTDGTDGSSLGSSSGSFDSERESIQLELPANTWRIEWSLGGATQASLRADGGTEYIAG